MPASGRTGSKSEIFMFLNSGYAHDRNISTFRRRASTVTGNTLTKTNYATVRQSRDLNDTAYNLIAVQTYLEKLPPPK